MSTHSGESLHPGVPPTPASRAPVWNVMTETHVRLLEKQKSRFELPVGPYSGRGKDGVLTLAHGKGGLLVAEKPLTG